MPVTGDVRRRLGGNGEFDPLAQTDPGTVPDSPSTQPASTATGPGTPSQPGTVAGTQPETPVKLPSQASTQPSITPIGKGQGVPDYLASLLNSGVDRTAAIGEAGKDLNLQPGQDGYPLYYDANKTIGLHNDYLAFVDGQWKVVPRGPEGSGQGAAASGPPAGFNPAQFGLPPAASKAGTPDDPFTAILQGRLTDLIGNNGHYDPSTEALSLENARQAADRGRHAEYSGALSELANRGLLPEDTPGGQGGLALDSLGRIERNDIAPLFSNAVRDYQINDANNASQRLMGALGTGVQEQGTLGNIAVQTLAENNKFSEFLADFGLRRDQALYDIQSGQASSLLMAFQQWLQGTGISAGGAIK